METERNAWRRADIQRTARNVGAVWKFDRATSRVENIMNARRKPEESAACR